jgi:hypothetical protein
VLEETAILDRNHGVDQALGKIVELYQLALGSLLALEELGEELGLEFVAVESLARVVA